MNEALEKKKNEKPLAALSSCERNIFKEAITSEKPPCQRYGAFQ